MKVAVEGCCHGELDKIYDAVQYLESLNNIKVDLLLICGDFQAVRNKDDLRAMAVPVKYQKLNTFYKYYSGEKVAPVLTIFIGGNHEASNYMQELPYGGWVAKNIYYMGYANVIQVGDLRIGGLSGIYKEKDFYKGHFEHPPYTEDTKRSVYHIRNIEVFRLKQLTRPLDIFMSHDWPSDIARYGNMDQLFSRKPFLKSEVLDGSLGSPPACQLLHKLQPSYWFSAHLHVKFTAHVQHSTGKSTRFLSLDKCLPRRQFLQVLDFEDKEIGPVKISLDPEWLCVLKSTNHLMHLSRSNHFMPGPQSSERSDFEVLDQDIEKVKELFGRDLTLPENFKTTAPTLQERQNSRPGPPVVVNEQTALLCTMLELTDPNAEHLGIRNHQSLSLDPQQMEMLASDSDHQDEDDSPTDVSSNISSFLDSSLDMSSSFCSPSSTTVTPPVPQVEDDDEEFKAILAAQRRNSQQMSPASNSSGKSAEEKSRSSGEVEAKGFSSAPKAESMEEEVASITAAQSQKWGKASSSLQDGQKLEDYSGLCVDKSSSDIDSTSQESQDESEQPRGGHHSSGTSTTDCMEVSTSSDSPAEGRPGHLPRKHPSPSLVVESPSIKKLKRRNVSMYSSSGTEDEPC